MGLGHHQLAEFSQQPRFARQRSGDRGLGAPKFSGLLLYVGSQVLAHVCGERFKTCNIQAAGCGFVVPGNRGALFGVERVDPGTEGLQYCIDHA